MASQLFHLTDDEVAYDCPFVVYRTMPRVLVVEICG